MKRPFSARRKCLPVTSYSTPPRRTWTCNACARRFQHASLCATHSASVFASFHSGFSRKSREKRLEFRGGLYGNVTSHTCAGRWFTGNIRTVTDRHHCGKNGGKNRLKVCFFMLHTACDKYIILNKDSARAVSRGIPGKAGGSGIFRRKICNPEICTQDLLTGGV